jgi:GNAT superfamily N-acetyltransferase
MVLGWSGSEITEHHDHLVIRTPSNPGFWWGNFLLLAVPLAADSAEHWRQVFATEFPEADHLSIGVDGTNGVAGDQAAIDELGLTVGTDTVLIAESLTAPRDVGAEIRPLLTDQDWQQMAAHRLAVDGRDPTDSHLRFLQRRVVSDRHLSVAGHGRWFGAFVDGRLASSAGIFTDGSGVARYQLVMTDPAFRRRGLASAVVHAAGDWARRHRDAERLVIVADPDDVAIAIYRRLGFVDAERQVGLERGPVVVSRFSGGGPVPESVPRPW